MGIDTGAREIAVGRWRLLSVVMLDIICALFFLLRGEFINGDGSKGDEDGFRFGGSIGDLSLLSFGRAAFIVGAFAMLCCAGSKAGKNSVKIEMILALLNIFVCLGIWSYLLIKMLARLVEDGPWAPSVEWYWSAMVAQSVFATVEMKMLMTYLRNHVVYRADGRIAPANGDMSTSLLEAEQGGNVDGYLLTPRQRKRKQVNDRQLFGSTFDWFYGRIDGKDAEEEGDKSSDAETEQEKADKESKSSTMVEMMKLTLPYWKIMIVASFALVLAAIGAALIPALTGQIIKNVTDHPEDHDLLRESVGKLLLAGLFTAIFSALRGSCFTVAKGMINMTLREKLLKSLLSQEIGFFDTAKSGKLNSRLNTDTTVLSDQVSLSVNVFTRSVVQAICVLVFMFRINVELSLATFLTVPAVAVVTQVYGDLVWHLWNEAQLRLANANSVSDAALTTMPNVRCFASEKAELARYHGKMELYLTLQLRMGLCYTVYAVIFTLLPCVSTALVLFYGGKLVEQGNVEAGDLVAFMLYQQSLSQAINDIGSVFSDIAGAMGAGDKVFELINRKPKETPKGDAKPLAFEGTIEFKDVDFRYPARPDTQILDGLSLKIKQGEVVALTGESGGGKSSILKLVERLYDANKGEVLLSGKPIDSFDHQYLHQKITIVSQEPSLYSMTIAENIAYGLEGTAEEPNFEQIVAAAKAANAHDFIMTFENGYETMCGDRGVMLSGGQKQRIAIARALVRSGNILLLDEATSALDSESETLVQETLDRIISEGNRTAIIVAHRLSTIRNADRIIAMAKGKIVEEGTHDDLIAKKGLYHSLVLKQMGSGAAEGGN